jgi:CP family cyanate transporter-like MFS transporter
LWVVCLGVGPILFPVAIVLINKRTRTHEGTVALSGFAQGVAYALGALGPLVVGGLHDLTGSWTASLSFLLATALAGLFAVVKLRVPAYVEDELAERA